MRRVITFGTFDLFHIGHLNIIERAKAQGDYLIVGVSSDALNFSKKHLLLYPRTTVVFHSSKDSQRISKYKKIFFLYDL